ncbi:Helicase loader DnaI [uncultured Gammaproteobacteria bacterium]|nr:Helicase loader DnaI [uncultured Gammaproteobacteria bacterium]
MQITTMVGHAEIVTDYRLNANHNRDVMSVIWIVTDYRLNANHNYSFSFSSYCNRLSPKCKSQHMGNHS